MTLTTPYQASFYVGDGETKAFPFVFEELSDNFVKVIVSHIDGTISIPTYTVDLELKQVVFGDETPAPTADDVVCIYRETPTIQDTPFKTLEGYNAKALENILSKIVAMIQEIKSNYFSTQVLQGDPWQLDLLKSADDGATVNIDYVAKKLVKGLYFQITDGNLQVSADGSSYITMPKSADIVEFKQTAITLPDLTVIKKLQYRVNNEWFDAETNAQAIADAALVLAQSVESDLSSHTTDLNNPHATSLNNLTDTDFSTLSAGQFIMFDGLKWKNVYSSAIAGWGTIIGNITDQTDLMNKFTEYVRTDGSSTMTNPLMMRATESFKCAIAPYWDGIGFFKLNDDNSVSLMASIENNSGFEPATTNTYNIGASARKWKNLYLSGKAYMSVINNGFDIAIPVTNSADTFALLSDVAFKSTDVEFTSLAAGQFLRYDGSKWVNSSDAYANTGLSNLTSVGQNIGNWSTNVTNCITEIPQDIKLELNAGVLTLKAGSKVYVPNGAGVFDVVTIANDLSTTDTGPSVFVFYDVDSQILRVRDITNSGTSDPQTAGTAYYDTQNNIINYYTMAGVKSQASFPLCIITGKNIGGVDTTVSIDQVFNGFGYIGSTVFALPGVKLLHPNGRNIDGTLNNTTTTVQNVIVTPGILFTPSSDLCINNSGTEIKYMNPTLSFYNNSDNVYYAAGDINRYDWTLAGKVLFNTNPTSITSLLPKTPFHAVDYGDTEYIAHQAMPSDRYTDLTLGASGAAYTAPADGYVTFIKEATAAQQYIEMSTSQVFANMAAIYNGQLLYGTIPVSKGATFYISYNAGGSTNRFRFIYANGAQ